MPGKINKKRAAAMLEEAQLLLQAGAYAQARDVLEALVGLEGVPALVYAGLAEAQQRLGDAAQGLQTLRLGLSRQPDSPELNAALGSALVEAGRIAEGVAHLEKGRARLGREPTFLLQYGYALIRARRTQHAQTVLESALGRGAGARAKLLLAAVKGLQGQYAEAEAMATAIAEKARDPSVAAAAWSVGADAKLFGGDAPGALAIWRRLREEGQLDPEHLGHMAYAAQLCDDAALSDELMDVRRRSGAEAEDLLLFAQIANLRNQPHLALEHLLASEAAPGERYPGHEFEVQATRGRALRLLGRRQEALEVLEQAAGEEEASNARLGPKVEIDLGHLAAEAGDFELAATHFAKALELDPDEPEAQRAMALTQRRVAWRTELEASAQARVEAARAEAEALKRRFQVREGELESLRRELERLKQDKREAERKAQQYEQRLRTSSEEAGAVRSRQVQEELLAQEQDIEQKAAENIGRALGEAQPRCPEPMKNLLLVAERTFQKALYTELPAAAVAVLFSGALERLLYVTFVEQFDRWLNERGLRQAFLTAAVRERRGRRVEYFDHFVEAFDPEAAGRAPSLGEVGRVLERRHESYLRPFWDFMVGGLGLLDVDCEELSEFVRWAKEKLRDPVAHGRGIELGYEELKVLREQLLFKFGDRPYGLVALLLRSAFVDPSQ